MIGYVTREDLLESLRRLQARLRCQIEESWSQKEKEWLRLRQAMVRGAIAEWEREGEKE